MLRRMRRALRLPVLLKRALVRSLAHDSLNLAQSAAYSAIVALFPAMIVVGAAVALLPDVAPLKIAVSEFFDRVLPSTVFPLFTGYFVSAPGSSPHTVRALVAAVFVSVSGASSVIATLMEGLRRAAHLPENCWTFWQRRMRALALVPLSLLPLMVATVLVMFGRLMTEWVAANLATEVRPEIYTAAFVLRWAVSLTGVTGVTALIYHMGVPGRQLRLRSKKEAPLAVAKEQVRAEEGQTAPVDAAAMQRDAEARRSWVRVVPGAVVATSIWFITTLVFGWYVTRVANYTQVYGSLGAGIALLFWLYFVFLSVLVGAEFNAQVG
jgi:membrane protein